MADSIFRTPLADGRVRVTVYPERPSAVLAAQHFAARLAAQQGGVLTDRQLDTLCAMYPDDFEPTFHVVTYG